VVVSVEGVYPRFESLISQSSIHDFYLLDRNIFIVDYGIVSV